MTILFVFRATMYYIEQAVIKFENKPKGSSDDNRVASVLEKLLKIDKHIAMIMALDMLMAGVDTVSLVCILIENVILKCSFAHVYFKDIFDYGKLFVSFS